MCSYGQLSELQTLTFFWWGQGQTNIHTMCSTSRLPNRVTVASRTTEIWPFEYREITTLDEVWILVIAFLERNFKKRAPTSCGPGPITNHQFWAPCENEEEIDLAQSIFRNFGRSVTFTLTLDRSRSHWCAYVVEVYPHTKLDGNRKKNFCGSRCGVTRCCVKNEK